MLRRILAAVVIVLALIGVSPAVAGPIEDGYAAYHKGDYATALRYWRPFAAEKGYALAQISLGFMYTKGEGMPQDYVEAVRWFRLAAEQGYAIAQFNLGVMYGKGEGVPQDDVLAHMWSNLAAAQGYDDAVENRDVVAGLMSPNQIAEAERLAREWMAAH
jgi:TPR repeat protein